MEKVEMIKIDGTDITLKKCETAVEGKLEIEIRVKVFMEEQGFSFDSEFDPEEHDSIGYIIYKDNTPIGCFNYIWRSETEVYFRRLCFYKEYRKSGYGKHVFKAMENYLSNNLKELTITFNGEAYLRDYWLKLGYQILGETSEGPTCPPLLICKKVIRK